MRIDIYEKLDKGKMTESDNKMRVTFMLFMSCIDIQIYRITDREHIQTSSIQASHVSLYFLMILSSRADLAKSTLAEIE